MGSKLKYYLNRTGMDIMDRLSSAVDVMHNSVRNQACSNDTPKFNDRLKDKILDSSLGQRISIGLTNFYAFVENNGVVFMENDGQIDEEDSSTSIETEEDSDLTQKE